MMTGACSYFRVLLQNFADSFKWPKRRIANSISHTIVRTCPAAFGPHEIIFIIAYKHKSPLYILIRCDLFEKISVIKWNKARKISIELSDITMFPSAINEVVLSICIFKNSRVNWLRSIIELVDQRLT